MNVAAHNRRIRDRAGRSRHGVELDPSRLCLRVPSRTTPGRVYETTLRLVGSHVVATCTCEAGRSTVPAGALPCWHSATAALLCEEEGLLVWDGETGRWDDVEGYAPPDAHPRTDPAVPGLHPE